jgi:hypothetical protein
MPQWHFFWICQLNGWDHPTWAQHRLRWYGGQWPWVRSPGKGERKVHWRKVQWLHNSASMVPKHGEESVEWHESLSMLNCCNPHNVPWIWLKMTLILDLAGICWDSPRIHCQFWEWLRVHYDARVTAGLALRLTFSSYIPSGEQRQRTDRWKAG